MKFLVFLIFFIILTVSLGERKTATFSYSQPAIRSSSSSSGLICKIDEEGHTRECDEENSLLPDDLKTNGAVQTGDYICLDIIYKTGIILKKTHHVLQCAYQLKIQHLCTVLVKDNDVSECIESKPEPKPVPTPTTPETPSGLYCIVDDVDNTVECNKRNSILPNDLDDGNHKHKKEYVCLDITYKTGLFPLQISHHVRQCALKLIGDDLCDVLQNKNVVPSCSQSTPYSSPTIVPPSRLYCEVDSEGDRVECSTANSVLPSDLNIGSAEKSQEYVCISVTYKTGRIPFDKTRITQQCALELNGDKDLCRVLKDHNNIQKCKEWSPKNE